jgi:NAD(P)-dependent dehydrogenase (short-subunit alcohol dehydrogenase family)
MAVIGITGSTDGIGRAAARVLLADGHRVLVHARSRERGEPVAEALGGDVALVVGEALSGRRLLDLQELLANPFAFVRSCKEAFGWHKNEKTSHRLMAT